MICSFNLVLLTLDSRAHSLVAHAEEAASGSAGREPVAGRQTQHQRNKRALQIAGGVLARDLAQRLYRLVSHDRLFDGGKRLQWRLRSTQHHLMPTQSFSLKLKCMPFNS